MIYYLTDAKHVKDYRFWVRFNTGEEGELDLQETLTSAPGNLAQVFQDTPETVKDFYLDPWPTLAWKCGFDISPEHLHELFATQNLQQVAEDENDYDTTPPLA
jgi:hypothetical protein